MACLIFPLLLVFVKDVFLVNIREKCLIKVTLGCAKESLQLIHTDICGPLEVPSISHAFYFLTFIDYFSRKSWVYFLKHKSETFFKFQRFKSLVENESGKKIKTLRTDNREEFIKKEFEAFFLI